ncbi:hypothetical protein FSP39_009812 [Pinctada imbricata]|uniref:E3 ubiquitin-protein ligase n=1 Tax=Pinctada imbricata TaxID=66713 RepID=A0AA88YIB9_PINIB|nr:hypothetical protein FSP39_009812 [Pinctada imbricata]
MAEGGETIIQKPIPTCDNHPSDEVEVYCKHCNKAVCFDCSRIHHHNHDCEGIVKLSRRLRQQIPETCQQIRDGTLYRMKSELESIRLIQRENKEKQKEEATSLENLQTQCMEAVKGIFQSEIIKTSENLKKHNDKLDAREQELIRKIENLNVHVQSHEDSQLTYGKFELLEMDMVLRKMTNDYRSMDTDGAVYSSSLKTPLTSTIIDSLKESLTMEDSLPHFPADCNGDHDNSGHHRLMEPYIITKEARENCPICMDEFTDPQKLTKCGHVFCKECIESFFSYKPSCPNCGVIYGNRTGDQPEGRIAIAKDMTRLPGYGSCNSIKVTYVFMDGKQGPDHPSPGTPYKGITRSGWLPDNKEGRLVAKLLNVAFTRKLVFTIGRSRTTGNDGVLIWNDIHHKTRTHGGAERFAYPDPTYIERVMDELSVTGVTEESADDPTEYEEYSKVF